ncbi:recombinase family protein [Dasania marina]|uniref:recombinase family protein n=1 Tax=Dasania marina TaxID=471499 RepID=UPI0030D82EAA|tara:strand:- start:8458 stop:9168 length:711 start_codon:yes stop_codon:yes gene_type:complete
MKQRYVAYYRVSTQKQGQSGLGLDAQRQAVDEYLSQYGGEVIDEFVEIESGKRADRPEFTKATDYAELANASVLVAKLDRLSRDLHFITSLQKRGIRFKLCDLPEIDQLTIHILAAMAEHEARMISVRTKQALQVAKARGVVLGNPLLEAQRNCDVSAANTHRVRKQQQWQTKILKVIAHLEDTEGLTTCQAIANALNDRELTTARGAKFSVAIISRLRRNTKMSPSSTVAKGKLC